jgi:hypothetical protein
MAGQSVGMLTGSGSVYVNGEAKDVSTATMVGDVIQTKDTGVATLVATGSSVALQSNTIVRLHSDSLSLDRGTVSVATGKAISVLARDFKIAPVSSSWTQYDVIRSGGTIQILARKNALTVSCGTGAPVTIKEGQEFSASDAANCGVMAKNAGAPPAATGPIITAATGEKAALVGGGALAAWALTHHDDPVSPDQP